MEDHFLSLILGLSGVFSVVCAAANVDFFMENSRAALFVRLLGRTGARVFYVVLGLFLCGVAATGVLS